MDTVVVVVVSAAAGAAMIVLLVCRPLVQANIELQRKCGELESKYTAEILLGHDSIGYS
jgi:hypothetical protein